MKLPGIKLFTTIAFCVIFIIGFSQICASTVHFIVQEDITKDTPPAKSNENLVVSESRTKVVNTEEAIAWINHYNQIKIPSNQPFSFLSITDENGANSYSHQTLSAIASSLYKTVLATNFEIVERHISGTLPTYAEVGFEARILPNDVDFVFLNPNPSSYMVKFEILDSYLHTKIIGKPLPHTYTFKISGKEELKPTTIVTYSSSLPVGETKVEEEGSAGYKVRVERITFNEEGNEIDKVLISDDYYPPIQKIIVHSLLKREESTVPNGSFHQDLDNNSGTTKDRKGSYEDNDFWGSPDSPKKGE